MEYITTTFDPPSTRSTQEETPKETEKVSVNIYKAPPIAKNRNLKERNQKLAYTENGKRIKPPTMIIEGKRNDPRLQPPKSCRLNLVHHLRNRTL